MLIPTYKQIWNLLTLVKGQRLNSTDNMKYKHYKQSQIHFLNNRLLYKTYTLIGANNTSTSNNSGPIARKTASSNGISKH